MKYAPLAFLALLALLPAARALDKPDVTYRVFQFPANQIPRIDGDISDWAMVPESYVIGQDQLTNGNDKDPNVATRKPPRLRVKVGWVKGLNRLYFLYESEDDFWDFTDPGLHNDIFEIIVDGDASGGPLVPPIHSLFWTPEIAGRLAATADPRISEAAFAGAMHGVTAQNYHVFTPAVDKDWCMPWGVATWIKELPWANAAQSFQFEQGESGKYAVEFWITPFDYAGPEGPARAVTTVLRENKIIGLSWVVIDYDGTGPSGFWMLAGRLSVGHASALCAFRLMPLEESLQPKLAANWSWQIIAPDRRLVAFKDESVGTVDTWRWDFGDGSTSTEQNPQHAYAQPGHYVTILDVTGPAGHSRRSKVREIQFVR